MECVCRKVSVCLKCVDASSIDFSLNLVSLYTTVSKTTTSASDVSALNLIVGWCKFSCLIKASMSGLLMSHREKYRLCSISKLLLRVVVSVYAMKMLAKETAVFVPIAVLWVSR